MVRCDHQSLYFGLQNDAILSNPEKQPDCGKLIDFKMNIINILKSSLYTSSLHQL